MPSAIGSHRNATSAENEKYFSCYTDFEKAWAINRQRREAGGPVEANRSIDFGRASTAAAEQILSTENYLSAPTDLDVPAHLNQVHCDEEEEDEWRKYWAQNGEKILSATWMSRWRGYLKLKMKCSGAASESNESRSGEIGGASAGKIPKDFNRPLINNLDQENWRSQCGSQPQLQKTAGFMTNFSRTTLSSLGTRRSGRGDSALSASSLSNSRETRFSCYRYPLSKSYFSQEQLRATLTLIGLTYTERDSVLAITGRVPNQLWQSEYQDDKLNLSVGTEHILPEKKLVIEPPISDFENVAGLSEEVTTEEVETRGIRTQVFKTEDVVRPALKSRDCKRKIPFPPEVEANIKIQKFWFRRFSLFRKFDEGIMMDEESWYSVTPEIIAKHVAERCSCDVIVDGFCGAGGNAIQFAFTCKKVIAIDIDPKKIELAKNNAEVYGVSHKIEFLVGDFFALAPTLEADVVFLSPPWGGTDYLSQPMYDLETMLRPEGFSKLFSTATRISKDVVAFLPKNSDTTTLVNAAEDGKNVEIEQNFINERELSITVYYNNLVRR